MILNLSENKRWLVIDDAKELEIEQLKISLTKKIKNWRFHPLVKKKVWDGTFTYIKNDKYIPAGLWREVYDIGKEHSIDIQLPNITTIFDKNIEFDIFKEWVNEFFSTHPEITPYDYQIDSAFKILKFKKCLGELATAAGKTVVLFIIIAYILEHKLATKILYIVPNVSLVIQAAEDFISYNQNKLDLEIQQIYSGQKIKEGANIVVSTYQSLVKKKPEYFKDFDAAFIDEAHKIKAQSIKTILENCHNVNYSVGVTGTVPKKGTLDRLTLMAYTGPLTSEISANYLQLEGYISKCKVKIVQMDYADESTKKSFFDLNENAYDRKKIYALESNYVINNQARQNFITSIILKKATKNTLVLFYRKEHGQELYNRLRNSNRSVYYIDGHTHADIREAYKYKMEHDEDVILVASFGTFATGISIKNIHYIFFTESFKSDIIIRQSIGRGLRLHPDKEILTIVDFVDDLRYTNKLDNKKYTNHIFKHGKLRQEIYKEQKFPYTISKIKY